MTEASNEPGTDPVVHLLARPGPQIFLARSAMQDHMAVGGKAGTMNTAHIGRRIMALRKAHGLKQEQLADILRIENRQSVSSLENGTRRVTADELIRALEYFKVTLEDISNPFALFDRESFSWRQKNVAEDALYAFEKKAGEWVGAYRALRRDQTRPKLLPNLRLTHQSSYEDAIEAGEDVAELLELGDKPAFTLAAAIEEKFGILVLMVDTIPGVSGAACHLPELNAILINRNDSPGRRQADLAHELFHILTWDVMKPERVESSEPTWEQSTRNMSRKELRNYRIEHLADNFNSGVLMPGWTLDALPSPREDAEWLNAAANEIGVTSANLKWRLVNSNRVPGMRDVPGDELSRLARLNGEAAKPALFSRSFMAVIAGAIEAGELSSRRAAKLLCTSLEELGELMDEHEVERPAELCI
jgi:transcriptional regulator with XRE-family HTH domain/Zn-dependent peptidase ImmA (M78 family)